MIDPSSARGCGPTTTNPLIADEQAYRACMTCGQCISRCFLTYGYPEMNPRKLVHRMATGHDQELAGSEFIWACTLCARCTTDCPQGIEMDILVRQLRRIAWQKGNAPERIVEGVKKAVEFGNNSGLEGEAFIDMAEWLAEELADEMEDLPEEGLAVPMDKEGAEVLYVPNPREYTSNPTMFQTYMKFFTYTNTDWTMSSRVFDITNWAYYLGDHEDAVAIVRNLVEEARRLKVRTLLSTECGHGFKILRKDAERWLGEPLGFEVLSVVELAHQYLEQGRLAIKPGLIDGRVTYHDPCNVGRKLGVFEEPRAILKAIAADFVELWPNRKYSICCGAGGSVGQNADMGTKRLEHARAKHDQIMRTQANIVTTSCQNCLSQLQDLQSRYDMPVTVKSVIELLVEAMDSPI
ncbi:MAG: (Fe-S)-binding protein [Desulfomonile tiedjei]|nr:(Fe-S)-binding protein [Desulfomonile tiedjei]